MKIKVLRNLGAGLPDYQEGQTVDCSETLAKDLARQGLAEIIEGPKPKPSAKPARKPEPKEETEVSSKETKEPPAKSPAKPQPPAKTN